MQPVRTYFLTGATGAIGSALVPVLLEDADAQVRLLIRAQSAGDLDARLESLYRFWGVAVGDTGFRDRVRALRGDVTEHRFGLEAAAYEELRSDCTHLVHAAGNVRMNLPIEEARRSAVESTRNVVALARQCPRLEKIEFVSTVGVGGRLSVVPETWLTEPRGFHNTYEQAKAEAEDCIRSEVERGLPVTVHRPSMVVGDSRTGRIIHFQIFYHLCEFLSGRRTLGLFPRLGEARLDTIPVDAVARAIAWSCGQAGLSGKVLHLCSGPKYAVCVKDLRTRVRREFAAHGLKLPPCLDVPTPVFTGILGLMARFMSAETRRAAGTLPVFLDYLASDQRFENAATIQMLAAGRLASSCWDEYADTVLGAYLAFRIHAFGAAVKC